MIKQALKKILAAAGVLALGTVAAHAGQGGMSMGDGMKMDSGSMSMSHGQSHGTAAGGHDTGMPVSASLTVSGCWIRALPAPAPSAGYFVVHNKGAKTVALTGASSPAFGMVMLHKTVEGGGMSKMVMVNNVPVPAKGSLAFKPGSYHAMLEKPVHALVVGASVALTLTFDSGEMASATCKVKPADTVSN